MDDATNWLGRENTGKGSGDYPNVNVDGRTAIDYDRGMRVGKQKETIKL